MLTKSELKTFCLKEASNEICGNLSDWVKMLGGDIWTKTNYITIDTTEKIDSKLFIGGTTDVVSLLFEFKIPDEVVNKYRYDVSVYGLTIGEGVFRAYSIYYDFSNKHFYTEQQPEFYTIDKDEILKSILEKYFK